MKSRDQIALDALRFIWSLIKNAEIDKKSELTDDEIVKVLRTEVKNRIEATAQYQKAGRSEIVQEEEAKLAIIQQFLPDQMGEAEITKLVDEVIASGEKDFGKIMSAVMSRSKGQADGSLVAETVKDKLNSSS